MWWGTSSGGPALNHPPRPRTPAQKNKIRPPPSPKKSKKTKEEECCVEASEEDAPPTRHPVFKPPVLTGFHSGAHILCFGGDLASLAFNGAALARVRRGRRADYGHPHGVGLQRGRTRESAESQGHNDGHPDK